MPKQKRQQQRSQGSQGPGKRAQRPRKPPSVQEEAEGGRPERKVTARAEL